VKLKAKAKRRIYYPIIKRLLLEYGFFASDSCFKEPDIEIIIDSVKKLPNNEFFRIDNVYFIGDNWIYVSDTHKLAKWKVYMEGLESDNITVRIQPNFLAYQLIPPLIVTPLIAFQLFKKGLSLVHAAAISDGENAILFTGFSGSGKTPIVLRAIDRGLKVFGDDHVILSKGKVLPFPTALSLFKYNVPQNSAWMKDRRLELELKSFVHKFSLGYTYPVTKVPIQKQSLAIHGSKLRKAILLEPWLRRSYSVNDVDKDKFVKSWMQNIFLDSLYLYKYLHAYSYVNHRFLNYRNEFKKLLLTNLAGCRRFVRISYPQNNLEGLFRIVLDLLRND